MKNLDDFEFSSLTLILLLLLLKESKQKIDQMLWKML